MLRRAFERGTRSPGWGRAPRGRLTVAVLIGVLAGTLGYAGASTVVIVAAVAVLGLALDFALEARSGRGPSSG